jgi:hypothetical protein
VTLRTYSASGWSLFSDGEAVNNKFTVKNKIVHGEFIFFNIVEGIVAVAFLTFLLFTRLSHIRIFFRKSVVLDGFDAFHQYLRINAEIIL